MSILRIGKYDVSVKQYELRDGGNAALTFEAEYATNFYFSASPEDLIALASWLQLETKLHVKTREELEGK